VGKDGQRLIIGAQMLVAEDEKNVRCLAWETDKRQGPFQCPECRGDVILKKGIIRQHHFAHRPPITCQYGTGESDLHHQAKRELYQHFLQNNFCYKCEIERKLPGVRPDISLYIRTFPVAIEIQRSSVDIQEIIRKAELYDKLGLYLLYLFPESGPNLLWHDGEDEYYCRPNQWEKFIHSMYFGRVYYWLSGLKIRAFHFGEFQTYVETRYWYDNNGDEQSTGGYCKTAKLMKTPSEFPDGDLDLVDDFQNRVRPQYHMENWTVPRCKLWTDTRSKWW
jgi:competence protein CoiA